MSRFYLNTFEFDGRVLALSLTEDFASNLLISFFTISFNSPFEGGIFGTNASRLTTTKKLKLRHGENTVSKK